MRPIAFFLIFGTLCAGTFAAPHVGILTWIWIALMSPQQYVWGSAEGVPFNLIQVVVTLAAWGISKEPKRIPEGASTVLLGLFICWITLTTVTALSPDMAWTAWQRDIKNMALGIAVAGLMTNKVRLHAVIWTVVLSLGYFGIKGGLFTVVTGGGGRVVGEAGALGDNNNLALALCMTLPLINYLRLHSERFIIRLGLSAGMTLTAIAVLGTYSRGGLLGLLAMAAFLWSKSRRKLLLGLCGAAVLAGGFTIMPDRWFQRMDTIQSGEEDGSFQGRVTAWKFAINVALARPLVGGGFGASETASVFNRYSEQYLPHGRAAHSIYFQTLGDHGFVGLILYLCLLGAAWRQGSQITRQVASRPDLSWAADLASMIKVSFAAFMVAGAALSMAYYDLVYLLIGALIAIRGIVRQEVPAGAARAVMARPLAERGLMKGSNRRAS
jgi:probable O-glycosylation ligase (exosortase A-associated)